jgi:plastocyanin
MAEADLIPRSGIRRAVVYTAALCLLLAAVPSGQAPQTGRLVGRIRLTTHMPGKPLASAAYPRRSVGDHSAAPLPEIRNVIVYIKDAVQTGALSVRRVELRQEHETFIPHTLAITRGSTVEFPNGDPFFHNVFSLSRAANFNLGRYKRGQTRARQFTKAGTVKVYCDIHSHMSATIVVFDHPYFTIPELDGSFEIDRVPRGDYTLVGWHERVGEQTTRVRVEPGKATSIEMTVPVAEPEGDAVP